MVFRIRDLLYEEKFTIAGAKKRLLDEIRGSSGRSRQPDDAEEIEKEEPELEPAPTQNASVAPPNSTQLQRVVRKLKKDLEDLLTRLNSDASIKR